MRKISLLAVLLGAAALGGCAVVSATANVVGAAGTLVGTTVNAAAGAVGAVANSGHSSKKAPEAPPPATPAKKDCSDTDTDPSCTAGSTSSN
jgi:hypothetical protein